MTPEGRQFTYPPIFGEDSAVAEVYRKMAKSLGGSFTVEWELSGGNVTGHVKPDNPATRQPENPSPEVTNG